MTAHGPGLHDYPFTGEPPQPLEPPRKRWYRPESGRAQSADFFALMGAKTPVHAKPVVKRVQRTATSR
jgi:hypothetical protein